MFLKSIPFAIDVEKKTQQNKSVAGFNLSVIGQQEGSSSLIGCSGFPTETVISRKPSERKRFVLNTTHSLIDAIIPC